VRIFHDFNPPIGISILSHRRKPAPTACSLIPGKGCISSQSSNELRARLAVPGLPVIVAVDPRESPLSSDLQADAHWLTPAGVVIFETLNLYGVDRCNRQNLADYGNKDRPAKICFRRILRRNNS
jgi:hypothetical protein